MSASLLTYRIGACSYLVLCSILNNDISVNRVSTCYFLFPELEVVSRCSADKHCRLQILLISDGVEIGVWKWVKKLKNSFRFRNSTISSRCIVCSEFNCYSDKKKRLKI